MLFLSIRRHSLRCPHGVVLEPCPVCRAIMTDMHTILRTNLNALLEAARPRLLRLAQMNGIAADLAEDVVQEACLEAWRHLEQLREPERFGAWLDGICRNICRRQGRALAKATQETPLGSFEDEADRAGIDLPNPHDFDPGEALERQDRQILLERALSHLSAGARELIELCYLAELPQREVAERLDMSLGALELRLHRARRHLRQVLSGALRADAEAFGLVVSPDEAMGWRETRQWCWLCGKHRLRGTFARRPSGVVALRLRCPDCSPRYGIDLLGSGDILSLADLQSFRPAMKRAARAFSAYVANALLHQTCGSCQAPIHLSLGNRHAPGGVPEPGLSPFFPHRSYLFVECPRCGSYGADLVAVLLQDPTARAFALDRLQVLFEPDILTSYAGQDVICSRLVDLKTAEYLTIMTHPETFQIMAILP